VGYFLVARLELSRYAMAVPVVLTVGGVALTALVNVRGAVPPRVPWIVMTALTITYASLVAFVMPALDHKKVLDDIGRWVVQHRQNMSSPPRVATYHVRNSVFRFYVDQHVTFLEEPTLARAFFDAPGPFYCLMRKAAFDEFVGQGVPLRIVYEREGITVTSGRVLFREHLPETHFVLATRDR
jgi:hypothetical protein